MSTKPRAADDTEQRDLVEGDLSKGQGPFEQAEQLALLGHYEWDGRRRRLIDCSQGYARLLGMTVAEVLAEASEYQDDLELVHPDDRQRYDEAASAALLANETLRIEYRIITRSGAVRHVREICEHMPDDPRAYFGTLLDITELKEAEQALRESHNLLEAVIEGTPDYIFVKDLEGRYTALNRAAARTIGRPVEEILGKTCFDLFTTDIAKSTHEEDRQVLSAGRALLFEHRTGSDDQIVSTTKFVYRDSRGQPAGIIGISRDITERIRAEEQIRHLAYHDELTGLPSLRLAKDRLSGAIARARREGSKAAVLYVDLDDFKEINDVMGHKGGDQTLVSIARRLRACVRDTDTVARVGGDEFIIIMTGKKVASATVAKKIIGALLKPVSIGDRLVTISASIGIATYPGDGDTPDALVDKADEVMYRVKRRGKNGFALAD